MPTESPATRRRARQSLPADPNVIPDSQPLANVPNGLRDRIERWQCQTGHDAVGSKPLDTGDNTSSQKSPETSSPQHNDIPTGSSRRQTPRRQVEPTQREWVRKGGATTPRKRIISDEHWKNKTALNTVTKSEVKERRPIEKALLQAILPNNDIDRTISKARAEREARRQRRKNARKTKSLEPPSKLETSPDRYDDRTPNDRTSQPDTKDRSVERTMSPPNPLELDTSARSPSRGSGSNNKQEDSPLSIQGSRYAQTLRQPPQFDLERPVRSRKGSLYGKTKEMLGFHEPIRMTSNRLPSIEAWLDDQPDPFTDSGIEISTLKADHPSRIAVAEPTRERMTKRQKTPCLDVVDPNGIWDSVNKNGKGLPTYPNQETLADSHDKTCLIDASSVMPRRRVARAPRPRQIAKSRERHDVDHTNQPSDEQIRLSSNPHIQQSVSQTDLATSSPNLPVQPKDSLLEQVLRENSVENHHSSSLHRRLTTHENLMTELSRPRSSRSVRKSRNVRLSQKKSEGRDLMIEILDAIKVDEVKYARELRTLIDGVIPVLLQCVLTRTDSFFTTQLFGDTKVDHDDASLAKPIVNMGISLERLKSLHNRIALGNIDSLLSWCQTAHKAYSDYLSAWRLGFQDIIVNLAPQESGHDEGGDIMDRDRNGDVVNSDGEKVDVAYLLKRPLVRIRKLSKDLCSLREALLDHRVLGKISDDYIDLTAQAKRKFCQEQGRLEDEAAANIDATRVRDICSIQPLPNVHIERKKRVRARDCFDMSLCHSTGQRMECKIELILRDNLPGDRAGGDVLICGVDENGKFLLFAPVEISTISARKDVSEEDLVIMIRGRAGLRSEWRELLALRAENTEAAVEWFNMLGSNPVPPAINRPPLRSFLQSDSVPALTNLPEIPVTAKSDVASAVSFKDLDIPVGEPSVVGSAKSRRPQRAGIHNGASIDRVGMKLNLGGGLQQKPVPEHWKALQYSPVARKPVPSSVQSSDRSTISERSELSYQTTTASYLLPTRSKLAADVTMNVPNGQSRHPSLPSSTKQPRELGPMKSENSNASSSEIQSAYFPSCNVNPYAPVVHTLPSRNAQEAISPQYGIEVTAVVGRSPASNVPVSPVRNNVPTASVVLNNPIRDQWAALNYPKKNIVNGLSAGSSQPGYSENVSKRDVPPGKRDLRQSLPPSVQSTFNNTPSITQLSTDRRALAPRSGNLPVIEVPKPDLAKHTGRSASSPLKYEYAPSTKSDSIDELDSDYSDANSTSDTSDDMHSEMKDEAKSLPDITMVKRRMAKPTPAQTSTPTEGTPTLAPSDSASQGPYRRAPPSSAWPADKAKRAEAMVCSWSESGTWQPLQDSECSIVVSPGLIEVFSTRNHEGMPLVAFDLTPIVQLRQGTAIDITIRSQPTPNSQIKSSNNTMFRSRTVAECNELYSMIHWARCNNPTYLELERSRSHSQPAVTFSNQQTERPKSWFGFGGGKLQRKNSYRAGSVPAPSIQESTASSGTVSNALSALKRFSRSSAFSINRSSVIRRPGRGTDQSLYSSSAETNTASGSGSSTPAPPTQIGHSPGKEGPNVPATSAAAVSGGGMINNMKIQFFIRSGQDWRPLGAARLSVLPAPTKTPHVSRPSSPTSTPTGADTSTRRSISLTGTPTTPRRHYRLPSSDHTPHRIHGNGREKRIMVTKNKQAEVVFLDAILGEACFEKIAERGIAINVWKEEEQIGTRGGVMVGKGTMYMMKFDSAGEASWVFGLCGTYRYAFTEN